MSIKYNDNGTFKDIKVKVGDNIPVGAEFDYDGNTIPVGYEEVDNPNNYSTDEVRIGTWIDGKPLYRKVVYISSLPNNTVTSYDIFSDTSIIDICFIDEGNSYIGQSDEFVPINNIWTTTNFVMTSIKTKKIRIKTIEDKSNAIAYITVKYTKTTDTVNS